MENKASASGISGIMQREIGCTHSHYFKRQIGASEALVKRLNPCGKLNGHVGKVNTLHFNSTGDLLVSGSDDKEVIVWNWAAKCKRLTYYSGHSDNIVDARIMPSTDDRSIITSAADGQVRFAQIAENGEVCTKKVGKHRGRASKLAIEPGSPYIFYSCGEDGIVQHFDLRDNSPTKLFRCSTLSEYRWPIKLNAIAIDPRNPNFFSVGGNDVYARIYDIRYYQYHVSSGSDQPVNTFSPRHLIHSDSVQITDLAYSKTSELLVSYNDELIYLFQKDMGIGSNVQSIAPECLQRLDQIQVYSGHRNSRTSKGVSFYGLSDEYVMSGSDCGHVFIWKKSGGELVRMMCSEKLIVNCVEPHPSDLSIATSGFTKSLTLWAPTAKKLARLPKDAEEIMAANKRGRELRAQVTLSPNVLMHVLRMRVQIISDARRRARPRSSPSAANVQSNEAGNL